VQGTRYHIFYKPPSYFDAVGQRTTSHLFRNQGSSKKSLAIASRLSKKEAKILKKTWK
jgi:hypothetical protein